MISPDTPFDQQDPYEGKQNGSPYPSVPTLDSPYGTPDGQPAAGYSSGSPYFPTATPTTLGGFSDPAPTTQTGGGFDWSQYQPVSDSGGFSPAASVSSAATSSGWNGPAFTAPTGVDMQNDPGYQFRIDQAAKAQQASAFGRMSGLTGGTQKAIGQTTQDAASAEYQNVFNRALAGYSENANVGLANAGLTNQAASIANQNSQFNAGLGEQHAQNQFGNYYNLAGLGLSAANSANNAAAGYGTNVTNLATGYGGNLAGLYGTQGNINASAAAGNSDATTTETGTILGTGNLTANVDAITTATGTLLGDLFLQGSSAAVANQNGVLLGAGQLLAMAAAVALAVGSVTGAGELDGHGTAITNQTADFFTEIRGTASASTSASATAGPVEVCTTLTFDVQVKGAIVETTIVRGSLIQVPC